MPPRNISFPRMWNAGFQKITTNSTATPLNSTIRAAAHVIDVSVETQDVRYRADGTAPTATTGVLLKKDDIYRLDGFNGTAVYKFIGAAAGAVLNIQAWRYDKPA